MADLGFPTSSELQEIAQTKMARLTAQRPVFEFFPIVNSNQHQLMWDQMDNYLGLQQIRGMNGEPPKISKTGSKRYIAQPGIYGEFEPIDEFELTALRQLGTFATPQDKMSLVTRAQDKLLLRELDRIESVVWNLLVNGTFSVAGKTGAVLATDTYTEQTYAAGVAWGTSATATPIADFRAVQLLARGYSVSFGASAKVFMNRVTWNQLISNTNPADLYGRRTAGLGIVNNLAQWNQLLMGEDLPGVTIYDEGYLTDPAGTFTPFIPNNKVVVIGQRPAGQAVGEYRMTRNANNPNSGSGPYDRVIEEDDVPPKVEVHRGHNGGPVLFFPSAIVVMTV